METNVHERGHDITVFKDTCSSTKHYSCTNCGARRDQLLADNDAQRVALGRRNSEWRCCEGWHRISSLGACLLGDVWRAALLVEIGRVLKADEPQVLLNLRKALSSRSKRAALHAGCAYRLLVRHPAAGPVKVYEFAQHSEACEELAVRHRTPQKLAPGLRQ